MSPVMVTAVLRLVNVQHERKETGLDKVSEATLLGGTL